MPYRQQLIEGLREACADAGSPERGQPESSTLPR
jgi:hypothetical protein